MKENKQPKLVKLSENEYQFEDIFGRKSEVFFYAGNYQRGFAPVKRTANDKDMLYRDMVGNISTSCHTNMGGMFYMFSCGNITFERLPAVCFTNEKFYEGVKMLLLDKLALQAEKKREEGKHVDLARYNQQKDRIFDMCEEKRKMGLKVIAAKILARKTARGASQEESSK
ncbi:MAG: hypothetical protein J6A28_02895 [Clostridia bacterium]|nr:hypothetical protein [Clostridia bacterium]